MQKSYLLTAITAAALGAGTMELVDLTEVNAKSYELQQVVRVTVSEAQESTVETFLGNVLCEQIKADFGISTCPASAIRQNGVSIFWVDDEENPGETNIEFRTNIKQPGSWVAGSPE